MSIYDNTAERQEFAELIATHFAPFKICIAIF